jgi:hypothetical protein
MKYARSLGFIALLASLALTACTANDSAITQRVQSRLSTDGVTDQVHVSTLRRIVKLEGVVADVRELNRAEMAAREVPGIMGVDNELIIQHPVNLTGATSTPPSAPPSGPADPTVPQSNAAP